jgi:hypothetical protein
VQPSLLVFLHPSNFFLKSGLKKVNVNVPLNGNENTSSWLVYLCLRRLLGLTNLPGLLPLQGLGDPAHMPLSRRDRG